MQKLIVKGGKRLRGEIKLQGSKNAALPIISAALLCDGAARLTNCPRISDVYSASRILNGLGCRCGFSGNALEIDPRGASGTSIPDELMREMRSSIIFMGALLGRAGECEASAPGGCELGPRPIDMHLSVARKLGAEVRETNGRIICRAPGGKMRGAKINLSFPSVGATENAILCAVKAEGETVINNAAREPEIRDLCGFLRACGADISGDGGGTIAISGVSSLHGCEYAVSPDRIAGATYLAAVAAAGGEIVLRDCSPADTEPFTTVLEQTGCAITAVGNAIYLRRGARLRAVPDPIRTSPHPGFPTDAQAALMAALTKADGTSVFEENIFDCRYRHTDALVKMGADIKVLGKAAVVRGVPRLTGASVEATDLRGGAAMAVAALAAEGTTEISGLGHIDRGYEKFEEAIRALGGDAERV